MPDNMLFADKPLTDPSEDRLNFVPFASHLAKSIHKMTPPDGLVIAIHGAWGSGKSSLLEFILHYLENNEDVENTVIIRFNPWWFSGQESLIRHFFDQLYTAFGSKFGKGVRKLVSSVKHLGDLVTEAPVPGAKLPKIIADKIPNLDTRNIVQVKKDIADILRKQEERVLVVIDDIDRLTGDEIHQLFALIKAVADFPNVVYLLAFDRDMVAKALSQEISGNSNPTDGERFLEKIIQVSFEIPVVSKYDLRNLFLEQIERIVGEIPLRLIDNSFHQEIGNLPEILSFISTPRDIFRFANTLNVTYSAVRGEVDPTDFITIEALRIFYPNFYYIIRSNKAHFTNQHMSNYVRELLHQENTHVQNLVKDLFPNLQGQQFNPMWRQDLRICSHDIFDVYFVFSIPPSGISREEMLSIIKLAQNHDVLAGLLSRTAKEDITKCRNIFERFPDYFGDITVDKANSLIKIWLDIGDEIIAEDDTPQQSPGRQAPLSFVIGRNIVELLKKFDQETLFPRLEEILSDVNSIHLALTVILIIGRRHRKYGSTRSVSDRYKVLRPEDIPSLDGLAVIKIQEALASITQFNDQGLRDTLAFWNWIDTSAARDWAQSNIHTAKNLTDFVDGFLSRLGSMYTVSKTLFNYFDRGDLTDRMTRFIENGELSAEQLQIAKRFFNSETF